MASLERYTWESGRFLWPITFEFTDPAHVRAICQRADGLEKRLRYIDDYQIEGTNLVYVLPRDCTLIIWNEENLCAGAAEARPVAPVYTPHRSPACIECCDDHTRTLHKALADPAITSAISESIADHQIYAPGYAAANALENLAASIPSANAARAATPQIDTQPDPATLSFSADTQAKAQGNGADNLDAFSFAFSQALEAMKSVQANSTVANSAMVANQATAQNAGRAAMTVQPLAAMPAMAAMPETASTPVYYSDGVTTYPAASMATDTSATDAKLAALEAKLDALISQRASAEAEALELERARTADAQIQALTQTAATRIAELTAAMEAALAEIEAARDRIAKEMANRTAALAETLEDSREAQNINATQTAELQTLASDTQANLTTQIDEAQSRLASATTQAMDAASYVELRTANAKLALSNVEETANQVSLAAASADNGAEAAAKSASDAARSAQNAAASAANAQSYAGEAALSLSKMEILSDAATEEIENAAEIAVTEIQTEAASQKTALTTEARKLREDSVNVWTTAVKEIENASSLSNSAARDIWQKTEKNIAANGQAQVQAIMDTGTRTLEKARVAEQTIINQGQANAQFIADTRVRAQEAAEFAQSEAARFQTRAGHYAASALELAQCAWDAAHHAALAAARPGVASVRSIDELQYQVSGVYFINPILNGQTPFMGVYPVKDFSEANFDGVFFLGIPYPETPAQPALPVYPSDPTQTPGMQSPVTQPIPSLPSGGTWLPATPGNSCNCTCCA